MQRRTALRRLAGGGLLALAGCAGDDTPTAGESLSRVTASCDAPDITLDAERTTIDLQGEEPVGFALALTWAGERRRLFSFGNRIPFGFPKYSTDRRLVLLPPDGGYERQSAEGWVPEPELNGPETLVQWELQAGETVARPWDVWANPATESYVAAGDHRFPFTLGASQRTSDSLTDIDALLSVRIE